MTVFQSFVVANLSSRRATTKAALVVSPIKFHHQGGVAVCTVRVPGGLPSSPLLLC